MALAKPKITTFTHDGETFNLKLGMAAVGRLEKDFDMPFGRFIQRLSSDARLSDIFAVFHALLLRDAGNLTMENVTSDEAATIIDEIGVGKVADLITKAVEASPLIPKSPPARGAAA